MLPPLMPYPTYPMTEAIGQQLRQARQARSLSLEQVAQATHLRVHYLQALEAGDLSSIPSLAQARGFLRIYADYVGLNSRSLLGELDQTPPPQAEALSPPPESPAPLPAGPVSSPATLAVFGEIGQKLQKQREVLGISLEDVERYTHLRTSYLKALEAGNLDRLPSPVQGRGMLSNYAEFLGMNPEPLLLKFAEGLQLRLAERQAAQQQVRPSLPRAPATRPSALRRFFSTEVLLGTALVVLLAAFAIWAAIRIFALQSNQQPAPTAPPIAAVLLVTASETFTPTPATATPTAPALAPVQIQPTAGVTQQGSPGTGGAVQVYITVRQRAWMRVLVDGEVEFEGRVVPGSAYQFSGDDRVEILTGDAAALQIFFNQTDLGTMGLFGQVLHEVFTQQGVQTPTPTVTLTPTGTERPTRTPRGTPGSTAATTATP